MKTYVAFGQCSALMASKLPPVNTSIVDTSTKYRTVPTKSRLRLQILTELTVRWLFLVLNVLSCVVAKRDDVFLPRKANLSPMMSRTYRLSTCSKSELFFQYDPGDISKVPRYKSLPWAPQPSILILSLLNSNHNTTC